MKSKNSPNLYEILRHASSTPKPADDSVAVATPPPVSIPATPPAGPAPSSVEAEVEAELRPRIAVPTAPPAPAPAPASPDSRIQTETAPARVHVAPPAPGASGRLATPQPSTPAPAPAPRYVPPPPLAGADPGEGVIRVRRNTALFAGLVVLGLLAASYIAGVHSGRGQAAEPAAPNAAAPAPASARKFAVQAIEYRARNAQERTAAVAQTGTYKDALARMGHKNVRVVTLGSEPDQRFALLVGEFADPASKEAKDALAAVKSVKIGRDVREPNFARTAVLVAAPQ